MNITNNLKLFLSKLVAMLVAIIMCMNLTIPVAHACTYQENVVTIPSKADIIEELIKIGFTDKEIEELFIRFPYEDGITLFSDSSHPDKTETYYISTNSVRAMGYAVQLGNLGLGLSGNEWAKIVINNVGWQITLMAGTIGFAIADMYMGPTGVKLVVTYRWTYGDNSMTWQYLPISYKISKY